MYAENTIGIGTTKVSLWCEVRKRDDLGIHFTVINGAWRGVLRGSTIFYEDGAVLSSSAKWQVLFDGVVPKDYADYESAIEYINSLIKLPKPLRGFKLWWIEFLAVFNKFRWRTRGAVQGWKNGYVDYNRHSNQTHEDDFDNIPF